MVYLNDIGLYYWLFAANTFKNICANHSLHNKALQAVYSGSASLCLTILLMFRLFILFCITMWFSIRTLNGGYSCIIDKEESIT